MAPIVIRTMVRLPAAVQYAADTTSTSAMPLAEHGDWQAFFDDDRYCLVYYFNTQTGTSQWEPPPNFPIPAVRAGEDDAVGATTSSTQPIHHQVETQQSEREEVVVVRKEEKKEESAFGWLFKGAIRVASDMIEKQQQEEEKQEGETVKRKESKPWWSFLVDDDSEEEKLKQRSEAVEAKSQPKQQQKPSFWDNFFRKKASIEEKTTEDSAKNSPTETLESSTKVQPHAVAPLHSMRTMQQQHTEWLKFLDNGETNPTIPLVPPSEREAKLQQKLYADSLARQDNLRRNYKAVQEHRSKTFSLSALKRNNPASKEWYQYLGK